jgi:hypothetical protein
MSDMQFIKIFHQNGLIYFDQIRTAELVLLRTDEENKYLMTIEIRSFEGYYNDREKVALEKQLATALQVPEEMEYVVAAYQEYITLASPDDLDGVEIYDEDNQEKYLYFGWHVQLGNNRLTFKKTGNVVRLHWTSTGPDALYNEFDKRKKENAVEIVCDLNFYVQTIEEWQEFAKAGQARLDKFYKIRRWDITEAAHPTLSEFERNRKAWELAGHSSES